ncbi:hypothetical protein BDW02DRAFT_566646 [Decorospora gaudefroyi]|uniref:Uncharacterized protein n=1 Tax=Decorospora gaudefroyi TaxID=184978 RepID=A0A6A5KIC0_9PLEO|nr:hypothetical protein BDW02DRAFT_566646 [Decorospora gaudefroyi]
MMRVPGAYSHDVLSIKSMSFADDIYSNTRSFKLPISNTCLGSVSAEHSHHRPVYSGPVRFSTVYRAHVAIDSSQP